MTKKFFVMGKNVVWRGWWYFRQGWSNYFTFLMAAVNTLTITYFLAIERYPALVAIFPNFIQYVLIVALIGIPLLVLVGYAHWKKTSARRAEVDIFYEVNPYVIRQLVNTEMVVQMNLTLNQHILKLSQGQKLSDEEINDLSQLQEKLSEFTKKRKFRSKDDMKFFNNIDTHFKK
tara:strand:+ start:42 stop:566 length:525 start_codon:yes stop_codon:yes gene_type:complete